MSAYRNACAEILSNPEVRWRKNAHLVDWMDETAKLLDDPNPPLFSLRTDARFSTCYSADMHVGAGRGIKRSLTTQKSDGAIWHDSLNMRDIASGQSLQAAGYANEKMPFSGEWPQKVTSFARSSLPSRMEER